MGKPSPQLMKFMETYGVDADEVWEVRAGGAWAIKHPALERIAAGMAITFDPPTVIEAKSGDKIVAILVTARMGNRTEWSIGEASPLNCKNAYFYAMAEKRGKDRCVLKLLNSHGALYSDSEADEFAQNGKPTSLPKKDSREMYAKMQSEIRAAVSRDHLKTWAEANKDRIAILPEDWADILRLQYQEQMLDLANRENA